MDVIRVFGRAVRRHGDQLFLFDPNTAVTYLEADARTDAVAARLIGLGIAPGDTVGMASPDRVSLWLSIIGCWKAGALPAMIDARTPDDALPYFVEDAGVNLVVAAPEIADRIKRVGVPAVVDIEEITADSSAASVNLHGPESPLFLSYTSGTTGDPKGVILTSESVTLGASCIAERLRLTREDVLLTTTPISSSFQLVAALMPALHTGSSVGLTAGSSTDVIWQVALDRQATILVAYPLTLADIAYSPIADKATSPFRLALSGGSSLAPRIKQEYKERLGIPLLESYGQSELGGFMALGAPHDSKAALAAGYAGRSLPDRLAFVGDDDCIEVPAGELGEVMVTHGYFQDYRNKPEKVAAATRGGVLHTGDIGLNDADGYLKVVGRLSEKVTAIERGGFLRDVEDSYYEHPSVQHAVAAESASGIIEGFVELRNSHQATAKQLQEHVAALVPASLVPRTTTVLPKMPRTFSGKADRLKLAARIDD